MKKQLKNLCLLTLAHNQSNINYDLIIIGQKVKMFKSEKEITLTQQGQGLESVIVFDIINLII